MKTFFRACSRLLAMLCGVVALSCQQPEELTGLSTADPDSPNYITSAPLFGSPYLAAPMKVGIDMVPYSNPEYVPYVHIERRSVKGEFKRIATLSTMAHTFVDSAGLQKDSTYFYQGQAQARGGALSGYKWIGGLQVK